MADSTGVSGVGLGDMPRPYDSWQQCSRGCPGRYSPLDMVYRCPRCGGLLDVEHDLEALKNRTGQEWRALLEARSHSLDQAYASGVWNKAEWVLPQLDPAHIGTRGEGHNPLLRAQGLERELSLARLWIKLCGNSPTGSFKDLGMTVLVSAVRQMRASGREIRAVVCASTGARA